MMILFVGSRGSGKTTVANIVSTALRAHGYQCVRQFPGLTRRPFWRSLWAAVYLWRFFDFEMLRLLGFKGRPPRRLPSIYRLYLPLAFKHDMHEIQSKRADILLYDSNVLRALISAVAQNAMDPRAVADFCARKVAPNVGKMLVVSLETKPEEAVARWLARDGVALSEEARSQAIAEREQLQKATDAVVEALATTANVSVVRVDGARTPEQNAEHIIATAEKLFGSARKLFE